MIRVAHVNVAKGFRGGERQTELLMHGLAERGVDQVLVARRGETLAGRNKLARCTKDRAIELREVAGNPLSVAAALGGVDLVHVHEGRSVYGAWLRRVLAGTPFIVTRRVDNPIGDRWITHQAYRSAARVVALSTLVASMMKRFDGALNPEIIYSSSGGLKRDENKIAEIRQRFQSTWLIGHVGALDVQKGQSLIIDVARSLHDSRPDAHFVLVGGGKDEAVLRQAAQGLPNLSFTGFVNNVGDYLAAFDLLVFPSRKEGLGSTLLDSMEQGLPIIASRAGGIPDIVHHGENGLLIDPDNADQLRQAVVQLLDDPAERQRLGANGREFAKGFTADIMCEKYLALYRDVLKKPVV